MAEPVLPGVYRIACPFGQDSIVHVYYVDAPQPALIDSGVLRSPGEAIGPALQRAGFSLGAVRHLFNTHGHWDHMGGNVQVRAAAPGCRTYAHQEDAYLLADVEQHARGYSTIQFRLLDDAPGREAQAAMLRRSVGTPAPVDEWIVDGARYDLGGGISLRALHTPGHSRGSTSYLLEGAGGGGRGAGPQASALGAGALFTGDGVQGLGSRPGQLPLIFDDSHAYRATIARLSGVPCGALCLGHSFCGLGPEVGARPGAPGRGGADLPGGERGGGEGGGGGHAQRAGARGRPGSGTSSAWPGRPCSGWRGPWGWSWTGRGSVPAPWSPCTPSTAS